MLYPRSLRSGIGLLAFAAIILLMIINLSGCSDEDGSPTAVPLEQAQAPALPDPGILEFDFSFFDSGAELEKSADGIHDNFVNAYLRAVVLGAMAKLTLAPPVAAFAVALHTVPVAQEDGAWIWTYSCGGPQHPLQVALRGMPAGEVVQWEMRVGIGPQAPTALWFEGHTNGDGQEGQWLFHDLDDPVHPVCGEIAWGNDHSGHYLQFTSREMESNGDVLRFHDADPSYEITFTPGTGEGEAFIRWHAIGTGSLQVPDYNGGQEACWDMFQRNVDCN
jgi:hypothetical protein